MPEKQFMKRLVLLWSCISAVRTLYVFEPSTNSAFHPPVEMAFLLFVLAIPVLEILILKRAAREYRDYLPGVVSHASFISRNQMPSILRGSKTMIGFLMLCLVSVLWSTRDNRGMTFPAVLGSAMNLLLIWWFANTKFRFSNPPGK